MQIKHRRRLFFPCMLFSFVIPFSVFGQPVPDTLSDAVIHQRIDELFQSNPARNNFQVIEDLLTLRFQNGIEDSDRLGAKFNLLVGVEIMRLKAFPLAKTYLLNARKYSDLLTPLEFRDLNANLAGIHVIMKEWEEASLLYQENLHAARTSGDGTGIPAAENNVGVFHLEKGDLDSAEWYFRLTLDSYDRYPKPDPYFKGSVQDNLARVYKQHGEYAKALNLYLTNVTLYADGVKKHSLMQALNGVAEMQILLGKPQLAGVALKNAEGLRKLAPQRFQEELETEWLRINLMQAKALGDFSTFEQLATRRAAFKDSIHYQLQQDLNLVNGRQTTLLQQTFEKEKVVRQLQYDREKAEYEDWQTTVRWIFIVVLLMVLLAGLAVSLRVRSLRFRQQSLRDQLQIKAAQAALAEEKLAQEQLSVENLELKVSLKQQDLINFALDNQRKREVLQQLAKKLKKVHPGQVTQANINSIVNDMIVQTQTETVSQHYEENIDKVNAEYKSKLRERFPNLSPADLELCGMIRLGMQAKEIAALRSVTENAILMARRRLRKRLDIKTGVDLREFLLQD